MSFRLHELSMGVQFWRGSKWPQDFHNHYYEQLATLRGRDLFSEEWWSLMLRELIKWKAHRPRSKAFLTSRAKERLPALKAKWEMCILPVLGEDIESVPWEQVESFVHLVAEIKNVSAPVFASKLCHFLAPSIFPVIDRQATGLRCSSYREYYIGARSEWMQTDVVTQAALLEALTREIGQEIRPDYPLKCKAIELCYIGRNQRA